jgi:mannosyl-oligosaccharide alpha-1,2-mannosidase
VTGDKKYQETAWEIFSSIERATKTEFSYSSISDVLSQDPSTSDASESFWMAETLKYFYLIFSPVDTISLDEYVFSTEAHPFRIPKAI